MCTVLHFRLAGWRLGGPKRTSAEAYNSLRSIYLQYDVIRLTRWSGFGAASASFQGNKEAATQKQHDLHSLRFRVSLPAVPFRLAERRASPFLTSPTNSSPLERGPSDGAIFILG